MRPVKQFLLGSAIGIVLGLIFAISLPHYEITDPSVAFSKGKKTIIVWEGKIGDQEVTITQKEIKSQ